MLRRIALVLALAVVASTRLAVAASGGPDGAGYSWRDAASGCPVEGPAWTLAETASFGTGAGSAADLIGPIDIGFWFPFHGRLTRQVWVHRTGLLELGDPGLAYVADDAPIPRAGDLVSGFVALHWDNVQSLSPAVSWQREPSAGLFRLSYRAHPWGAPADIALQAVLDRSGGIRVEYLEPGNGGATATIGMEGWNEIDGLQVSRDGVSPEGFDLDARLPNSVCYARATALPCAAARDAACGRIAESTSAADTSAVSSYGCATGFAGHERIYRVHLDELSDLSATLGGTGSRTVRAFILGGCSEWSCLAGGTSAVARSLPAGDYLVVVDGASALDDGPFTLDVACTPIGALLACESSLAGTTSAGERRLDGYPCLPGDESGGEAYFRVDVPAGAAQLAVSLDAGSRQSVHVLAADASLLPQSCLASGVGAALLPAPAPGRYLVVVDGPPSSEGPFRITAACAPQLACPPALGLACNERVGATTAGEPASVSAYGCGGPPLPGPETTFRLSLAQRTPVGLVLDDSADPSLEILLLDACNEMACMRRHGDTLIEDLPAGDYVVVVDGMQAAGAPFTLLATCGTGLVPEVARFAGDAGDCFDEAKIGFLTPGVPQADVLLALDVSGSMREELAALQAQIPALMDFVAGWVQDPAFAITSFVDYSWPDSGMAECWYSGPNYGRETDYPYRLDRPMTTDRAAVEAALATLTTLDGLDAAEPYTRALHEASWDPGLGWRPGSRRIVVTIGDELMHACNPLECLGDVSRFPRGPDFGRDGAPGTPDDLPLLPTVDALAAAGITWLHVDSSGGGLEQAGDGSRGYTYAQVYECLTARAGGAVRSVETDGTSPSGETLSEFVAAFVRDELAACDTLRLEAEPGFEAWLADAGVAYADVALPATRDWTIRLCIPPGTPAGVHAFEVRMTCDGTPVAAQLVEITVAATPCAEPAPFSARAQDVSDCSKGMLVTWDPIAWPDPATPGVIHVYRGTADCADATRRAPLVTGLPGTLTSWFDRSSPGAGTLLRYVVEAEAPGSASGCTSAGFGGGPATRACVDPPVADAGTDEFPAGVGAVLRVAHRGQKVTVSWPAARALRPGEHFHLLKAWRDPRSVFPRVNAEADLARSFTETDTSVPLQFFDVRVANACEDVSLDEFPPGWDGR